MTDLCFQLKGSVVTTIIIELKYFDASEFVQQLAQKIEQAPSFFHQCPVILDVSAIEAIDQAALDALVSLCEDSGLQPIGFKGENHAAEIGKSRLALLPDAATRNTPQRAEKTASQKSESTTDTPVKTVVEETLVTRPTKVIENPVRSGQQVYAGNANLVVLGNVSEGAEVLADGDIHVYGALRGRALAGVRGDESARIFCQQLDAELLSIAGNFILSDSIDSQHHKNAVQVLLDAQSLHVKSLY